MVRIFSEKELLKLAAYIKIGTIGQKHRRRTDSIGKALMGNLNTVKGRET